MRDVERVCERVREKERKRVCVERVRVREVESV